MFLYVGIVVISMNIKKFELGLRYVLIVLFFVSGVLGGFYRNWFVVFMSFISLFLIIFSTKFTDKKGIQFSSLTSSFFLIFVFLSLFLGEINSFYAKLWWWDLLIHSLVGFALGLMGFSLVYYMNKNSKEMNLNPYFIAFFGFCFAITLSVFWEFFEFSIDYFFKTNMLKSGLLDTMGDLIVSAAGALIISLLGYFGLKRYYKKAVDFFGDLILRND
jgi:hypothetical protein